MLKKSLVLLIFITIFISSFGVVFAQLHADEHGDDEGHEIEEETVLGLGHEGQHRINQIAYTITAIISIVVVIISIMLIKATGQTDKFTLISIGFAFFALQSILSFLFWITEGNIFSSEFQMMQIGLFNLITVLFIGIAFYKWKKMLGGA